MPKTISTSAIKKKTEAILNLSYWISSWAVSGTNPNLLQNTKIKYHILYFVYNSIVFLYTKFYKPNQND